MCVIHLGDHKGTLISGSNRTFCTGYDLIWTALESGTCKSRKNCEWTLRGNNEPDRNDEDSSPEMYTDTMTLTKLITLLLVSALLVSSASAGGLRGHATTDDSPDPIWNGTVYAWNFAKNHPYLAAAAVGGAIWGTPAVKGVFELYKVSAKIHFYEFMINMIGDLTIAAYKKVAE